MQVYFDNAATTPLDPRVLEAMLPYLREHYGNPSSIHGYGRVARTAVEKARKTVAGLLNVSPAEIFFTSGGTEANNTILFSAVESLGVKHMISSPAEHHCVLHPLEELERSGKITLRQVKLDGKGHVELEHLEQLLKEASPPCMVSLMHANNEIGNLLRQDEVSTLCARYGAFFNSDTVQTVGHYRLDLQACPVHFIAGSAHKFHGPKGAGFLYISHRVRLKPRIFGGSQERNMRAGTENVSGIVGLAAALELACPDLDKDRAHVQGIKDYMARRLKEEIPGVAFNGDWNGESLYTVLNVSLPPHPAAELMLFNLDIAGVAASAGSACSSGSDAGSHVLRAIGADLSRPSIRFSFSRFNKKEEVDFAVSRLKEIYAMHVTA